MRIRASGGVLHPEVFGGDPEVFEVGSGGVRGDPEVFGGDLEVFQVGADAACTGRRPPRPLILAPRSLAETRLLAACCRA
jgi:hypothetical protein